VTGALSLLAGVLLSLTSAAPATPILGLSSALLVLAGWFSPWRHRRWAVAASWLLAGQCLAGFESSRWLELRLPVSGADSRVLVEGRVVGIPVRDGGTLRFDLLGVIHEGAGAGDPRERRLRLHWRDDRAAPRVGERWQLLVRLQPLEELRNFAGFDAARRAFRDDVHAAGQVLPSRLNELRRLAPAGLDTLRARIAARVRDSIADPDAASLVTALAVGLTAGMSREQWRVFNATGTTHLVAISGLHVTLFAWLAFGAARWSWNLLPVKRRVAREPFALLLGLTAAGGYALLAGWSVPTQRTWLMLSVYVAGRLVARDVAAGRLWSLALVLVLLIDVRAPLASGFWLSFVAVGVLLAFLSARRPGDSWWSQGRTLVHAQLAIMVALAPAGLSVFGGVSLVGLVVNLVAIPIVSFVFVPLVLIGALLAWLAPTWSPDCFALVAKLHEGLWPALAWCAELPSATWRGVPPAWWFLLAVPAAFAWLCRWPWPMRWTAVAASLPLLFPAPRPLEHGAVRISVLDAGSGTAVLLRTRSRTLLFDTGDAWGTRGSRMIAWVFPALEAAGLRSVDVLVLPVLDDDRARAAALLAAEQGLGEVRVPRGWPGSGLDAVPCTEDAWAWDSVTFHRFESGHRCRLRVATAGSTLLLGAGPGGSTQWIETDSPGLVTPGLAVATGGIDGAAIREQALSNFRARGWRVLDTHRDGGIELVAGDRGIEVLATATSSRHPFLWRQP
jgi:competence protein ComEC